MIYFGYENHQIDARRDVHVQVVPFFSTERAERGLPKQFTLVWGLMLQVGKAF
jgi:hypothetical protein